MLPSCWLKASGGAPTLTVEKRGAKLHLELKLGAPEPELFKELAGWTQAADDRLVRSVSPGAAEKVIKALVGVLQSRGDASSSAQ